MQFRRDMFHTDIY